MAEVTIKQAKPVLPPPTVVVEVSMAEAIEIMAVIGNICGGLSGEVYGNMVKAGIPKLSNTPSIGYPSLSDRRTEITKLAEKFL